LRALPLRHRDPFDRFLICQALAEGLTLVPAHRRLAPNGRPIIWT
jgi:PIN domain nuclease of toxin-antitoxin system